MGGDFSLMAGRGLLFSIPSVPDPRRMSFDTLTKVRVLGLFPFPSTTK